MLVSYKDAEYWVGHNVTNHHKFSTVDESLQYLSWRNSQYYRYDTLMSTEGYDDQVIIDYGCGPGHDLVGLGHYSKPKKLYGLDVSTTSLEEAKSRLNLHGINAELIQISVNDKRLPFEDNSVDYIHSSGVLHHIPNYLEVLKEFKRILKPGGTIKIMVYNYNSIWLHLYVAYIKQIVENIGQNEAIENVFSKTTDGPDCPTSYVFKPDEFISICSQIGLSCNFLGAAISIFELSLLPKRFDALMDLRFPKQHRDFLLSLSFDQHGCPLYENDVAGIDACYLIHKS
ncbi:class I SAM-dependent methyltransferase [Legionella spiritensis]|uniref:class I SAM-dependent methyltransferase n=1 Tax=Legionella spiritensis TaxID=452 RepID=UPI000F715475|nr:class I SAM-dependent methyltransferase [Legionella spiritensis]VEG89674.1 biotin synthase BioC [Legionella spiritensis]